MDDIFDPAFYGGDADPLEKRLAGLYRDGTIALQHLEDADSYTALLASIKALDDPTRRAVLAFAVIALKRHNGMTDEQFRAWTMRDLPPEVLKNPPPGD